MDPLQAKANFFRVCRLLVDKGGDALRVTLHALHPPPPNLATILNANKPALKKLKHIKVINVSQWDLLFPTSGAAPDSNNFDVTLLTILLRNICGLSPPATGWDKNPPAGDTSKSADIARIKIFRNQIYGHVASAQLDDATLNKLWQEISDPLIRLGIPQKDIDEIKAAPLSPEEESYSQQLKEWKEREEDILSKLNNVEHQVSNLQKTVEKLLPSQCELEEWEPKSCLPDKLPLFTGREDEIQKVITLLKDEEKAVVALHGAPGFGKTAIAIQMSHKLSEDSTVLVVFSQLADSTNEDKMIRELCLDVGVNHEDDPKQSLIFRLKNIKRKVIFVIDNIDNLLEEYRSSYDDFICLLRKHSNCQIVTTSRLSYSIPDLSMDSVGVSELEIEASIELLKKHCRKGEGECCHQDEKFLRSLAGHCGHVPLAMCIASSLVDDYSVEDSDELLQDLEKQPMETLECPESNQFVKRAINLSYVKCSRKEQEAFLRLSVFEGSFSEEAATAVIEKKKSDTRRVTKELFRRNLIKQPTQHRYSIHLLIKHFLKDKCRDEERARAEALNAEALMVNYYLELGNRHTLASHSKDCYKEHKEALKQEASNIQSVLQICCRQKDSSISRVPDVLASSKIYNTTARLFSIFIRSIIPRPTVHKFLQRCANLAKEKKQNAIKLFFDCFLAAEERGKSIANSRSDDEFISKMEIIKEEFETHTKELEEDKAVCAHFYYQYGRSLSCKSKSQRGEERLKLQYQAREQLVESLKLREKLASTPEGKANQIFALMHLGNICKSIYSTERFQKHAQEKDEAFSQAEQYYRNAIKLSEENLGEHALTSWCHKHFGDLYFTTRSKHDQAEKMYTIARKMSEKLGLGSTTGYAFLLSNLGTCLQSKASPPNAAIDVLEKARDIADELAESNGPNECTLKVYTSLAECLKESQRTNKAIEVLKKAGDNAERLAVNDEPTVYKIKVYLLLAAYLKENQRANEAIEVLEKARDNAERVAVNDEPTVDKAKVYKLLAECLKQCQRTNEAIEVLKKACDNAKRLAVNDEPNVYKIKLYLLLAECLKESQRANEAIEVLEKARDNAERLAVNDEPTVYKAKVYKLLAECLKQCQRTNEAIEVLEKACENAEKLAVNDEPTVDKTKVYKLLAECLKQCQRTNEAIEVLEKACDNADRLAVYDEPNVFKIKLYLLLAECLKESQRTNEAIEVLEKARDNAEKLASNDEPNVYKIKVYTSLAIVHHVLENYSEAVRYASEVFLEFPHDDIERVIKKYEYEKLQEILLIQKND